MLYAVSEEGIRLTIQDRYVRMRQIYETIDRQSYQWVVVLVAGLGFFLDGYTVR
jgi:PHS family inorganic phosphate transporter-like MFS transporter